MTSLDRINQVQEGAARMMRADSNLKPVEAVKRMGEVNLIPFGTSINLPARRQNQSLGFGLKTRGYQTFRVFLCICTI